MTDLPPGADFVGAKIALFCQGSILTYLRDDKPGLPFAAHWDLPGGQREPGETPEACLLREVAEEFGLNLTERHLQWRGVFPSMLWPDRPALFYGGTITRAEVGRVVFGDEGQCWQMMALQDWLSHPRGVPEMQRRSRIALGALGLDGAAGMQAGPAGLGTP